MKRKTLKPYQAKTFNQVCKLPRDNIDVGDWWMLIDGSIVIREQPAGEDSKQGIIIPPHVFEKIARWYLTGSAKPPKRKAVRRGTH